ncbi:MAG: histidinol-phosphate transaminase [Alphaproteobacteria bacterium]
MSNTSPLPQVKPGIMDIAPYIPGKGTVEGVDKPVRIAANENPLGCSPLARQAFVESASQIHRYPAGGADDLRDAIAHAEGLSPDAIFIGAGSDELITLLARAYAGPGDEVLYSAHGFAMYPLAALAVGATPVAAPEQNLTTDVDALLAHQTERTRICYLANPNNPTGTLISAEEVRRLRAGLRDDVILVLDAAYAEFITDPTYDPGLKLAAEAPNTVMLRTFSKIHGLAGLRLGWMTGPQHILDVLQRLRSPFNANLPAQAAGVAAIGDTDFVQRSIAHNTEWLSWTRDRLTRLGLTMPQSHGNFLLADFGEATRAEAISAQLTRNGILLRPMGMYGLGSHLRISIGLQEDMKRFIEVLEDAMSLADAA